MTIEEAWDALRITSPDLCGSDITSLRAQAAVRAAMLVAHVDACVKGKSTELTTEPTHYHNCGDGWYCERAREIQAL